jgi:Flp pilus assembly pilin Flp
MRHCQSKDIKDINPVFIHHPLNDAGRIPLFSIWYSLSWQKFLPAHFFQKGVTNMFQTLVRFVREEEGQDFAEYALILGAVGVVAIAVIAQYKTELIAAFQAGIQGLRAARGG